MCYYVCTFFLCRLFISDPTAFTSPRVSFLHWFTISWRIYWDLAGEFLRSFYLLIDYDDRFPYARIRTFRHFYLEAIIRVIGTL